MGTFPGPQEPLPSRLQRGTGHNIRASNPPIPMPASIWVFDPRLTREEATALLCSLSERGLQAEIREIPSGLVAVVEEAPPDLRPPPGVLRSSTVDLPPGLSRRRFLDAFASSLAAGVLLSGAGGAALFASPPTPRRDDVEEVVVGTAAEIRARGSKRFRFGREPCVVVAAGDRFHALSTVCSHLGCLVRWTPGSSQLECPCHRAVFDLEGNVLEGPPPRPLRTYPVKVDGGRVVVGRRTAP